LAIDATAARRHFAALLLYWPNGILTCLLRLKANKTVRSTGMNRHRRRG